MSKQKTYSYHHDNKTHRTYREETVPSDMNFPNPYNNSMDFPEFPKMPNIFDYESESRQVYQKKFINDPSFQWATEDLFAQEVETFRIPVKEVKQVSRFLFTYKNLITTGITAYIMLLLEPDNLVPFFNATYDPSHNDLIETIFGIHPDNATKHPWRESAKQLHKGYVQDSLLYPKQKLFIGYNAQDLFIDDIDYYHFEPFFTFDKEVLQIVDAIG